MPLTSRLTLVLASSIALVSCSTTLSDAAPEDAVSNVGSGRGTAAASGSAFAFADLEQMVGELEPHTERNPNLVYPIQLSIDESPVVNAAAGYVMKGGQRQSVLFLNRGMIDAAGGDRRLLRAVIAHELSHIELDHALRGTARMRDVDNAWTRAEEHEADVNAVRILEDAGYAKQDVVDMLLLLDADSRTRAHSWFHTVCGTHASPVMRVALLGGQGNLYDAVAQFEIGLAYMECRRYREAMLFFDRAVTIEPRLHEAKFDAASAALQHYYESLPDAVLDEWLRPDFGTHLTSTSLMDAKGLAITDEDRQRYAEARERLNDLPSETFPVYEHFLGATALVLDPDGDAAKIQTGVNTFRTLLSQPFPRAHEMGVDRLRYANNAALGLQRLGRPADAARLLADEQAKDMRYVPAAAANFGRLPLDELPRQRAAMAVDVLTHHLRNTSASESGRDAAVAAIQRQRQRLGIQGGQVPEPRAVSLCAAARIVIDGKDVGLFDRLMKFTDALGPAGTTMLVDAKYPHLGVRVWGDADVILVTEREGAMKITSYRPGTEVVLESRDAGQRQAFTVSVGMLEAQLDALLLPTAPVIEGTKLTPKKTELLGRAFFKGLGEGPSKGIEEWTYYPWLNLGVRVEDGVVVGLSVTPVK